MLILKHNQLSAESLFKIERQYLRWIDNHNNNNNNTRSYASTTAELNVLDARSTEDLYGYVLGIFDKLQILDTLNISTSQFLDFLIDVDTKYNDTPYHSFYHATDVVVVLYYIIMDLKAKKYLSNLEIATLFISAICHDAGHTGYNNDFHCKLNTELAIRYQYTSVLESLSVDISNDLLSKHEINMIDKAALQKLILSTDMSYHYELLNEANVLEDLLSSINLWDSQKDIEEEDDDDIILSETLSMTETPLSTCYSTSVTSVTKEQSQILNEEQRLSFMKIILHAADISNTVRVWPISKQWSDLIVQEFFQQGDAEKANGLPVSPGMDRDLATQASISLKFGDYVVKPYFEALASLLPLANAFIENLEENREEWLKLKQSPFATSITSYFNGFLQSTRFTSALPNSRKVSVPAGTVQLLPSPSNSSSSSHVTKPMPILRTTSHQSNLIISPPTPKLSTSTELKRNHSLDQRHLLHKNRQQQ